MASHSRPSKVGPADGPVRLSSTDSTRTPSAPVLLVGVDFGLPHFDSNLEELGLLAQTAGLEPVARITCKRKAPDAALFVGSGKADEIRMLAQMHGAVEVLFDQSLSPAQQRNLERHLELPVNDRTLLILEIFAQRARSHEGKLQVELARLQYLSTRLVRRWSHLERQRGGIGARGGPGETQIELDRRMISDAVKRTKERLVKVKRQRSTQRRQRERRERARRGRHKPAAQASRRQHQLVVLAARRRDVVGRQHLEEFPDVLRKPPSLIPDRRKRGGDGFGHARLRLAKCVLRRPLTPAGALVVPGDATLGRLAVVFCDIRVEEAIRSVRPVKRGLDFGEIPLGDQLALEVVSVRKNDNVRAGGRRRRCRRPDDRCRER